MKKLTTIPDMISLGGGLPSHEYFPFQQLEIKVPTPPGFSPEATEESGSVLCSGKHDIREGKSLYGDCPSLTMLTLFERHNWQAISVDLEVALNYGQATGSSQLLRFVTEHTEVW